MSLFSYQMPLGNVDKFPKYGLKCSASAAPLRIFSWVLFLHFVCLFNTSGE